MNNVVSDRFPKRFSRHARRSCRTTHASHLASRDGFTLIELLVSSLLTVILMTAVFTVLNSCFRETRQLQAEQARQPSMWLLQEQIRRDVQNAQGIHAGPNTLQLYGYIATDHASRMPTLERAVVTYQVRQLADDPVLIREEQLVGGLIPAPLRRDVVWQGVRHFDATAVGGRVKTLGDGPSEPPPDAGGLPAMPPSLRIVLQDDTRRVLLRETFLHHQEL